VNHLDAEAVPLVRVHSECLTGDVFGSTRCDCGPQLDDAILDIGTHGGLIIYMRQEGRGIGLYNKIDAYALQDHGSDTFQANILLGRKADERSYLDAARILKCLGLPTIRLITNNPQKVTDLERHGIRITEVVRTATHLTADNMRYLSAKQRRGHLLDITNPDLADPSLPATAVCHQGEIA